MRGAVREPGKANTLEVRASLCIVIESTAVSLDFWTRNLVQDNSRVLVQARTGGSLVCALHSYCRALVYPV